MSIETPWANDAVGNTKLNATRLLAYTPLRGSFTNPNGNVVGSPGNTYLNTVGGAGTTLWVKESGVGTNAGWVATGAGGGGGTVTSVTATDATIAIAGSASAPTVGVGVIPESKVTNLTTDLAAKADLVSGKVPTTQLATGTASSTTFHRGDGTWAAPAGGAGTGYGTVTDGNLTDLPQRAKLLLANGFTVVDNTPYTRVDAIPVWDVDPSSANGVTKLNNTLNNLLSNSGFEFWDWAPQNDGNPLIHEPTPYTLGGSTASIARATSLSQGLYSAQVTFVTQNNDQLYQLYNVPSLDANQWFTFTATVQRISGTGSIRMYLVQDVAPFTYYASLNPVVATGGVQTVMITGQCPSGNMRVGFQQTTTAGSVWQFDSWGLYKSKGVAPGWSPAPIDDTSDQLVRGRKTFYPLTWTTVVPDGSDYVQLSPLGNAYYYCLLPNNTVGSNLRQQVVFALLDPDYNRVRQYNYSAAAKIYLVIEQNSIGGCFWGVSPSTIQWENGYGYSAGPYTTTPIDLSPNTITYCEFTFMGNRLGWMGKMFTGIPPQWSNTPASFSWTNTNGNGWPAGIGQAAVNTQLIGIPINFGRHVPAGVKKMIYNAFTQCCSASMRTRIANNNGTWEIGAEFNADGPGSRLGRGTSENSGGYSTGPGGLEGPNWATLGLVNFSTFGYVNSAFNTNMAIATIDYAVRGYVHEMCHAISSQYYGENNPAPPTGEPNLISQHSTMLAIKADCVANGDPANPPNAGDEWLAETEVYRRIGASGLLVDNATSSNSAILKQMGYKTNAGTGGTGGTPTQRYNRFVTYLTSLIGNN